MRILLYALLGLSAVILLLYVRVRVFARLCGTRIIRADIIIAPLCGLIPIRFKFEMNILKEPVLTLYSVSKNRRNIIWSPGFESEALGKLEIPTEELLRLIRTERLDIDGELGINEDAFATAMLTGALTNALLLPLLVLLRHEDAKPRINIKPVFNANALLLNLTGIARFTPIHIMYVRPIRAWLFGRILQNTKRKGQAHGTSDREHHEIHNGGAS